MIDWDPMPCASCGADLEPCGTPHGIVWVCRRCVAGATTLGVIRKIVPRGYVNHLWQAAQRFGRESQRACPSCTRPLLDFRPDEVELSPKLEVCCRCFLIWLDRPALLSLRPPRTAREEQGVIPLALAAARRVASAVDAAIDPPAGS